MWLEQGDEFWDHEIVVRHDCIWHGFVVGGHVYLKKEYIESWDIEERIEIRCIIASGE